MPYKLFKQGSKTCVKNSETGESKGCSKTHAMAVAHMRALYAAESGAKMGKKETDEDVLVDADLLTKEAEQEYIDEMKEKGFDIFPYAPSVFATTFDELDEAETAAEFTGEISELVGKFGDLASNIMYMNPNEEKIPKLKTLLDDFNSRLDALQNGSEDNEDKELGFETMDEKAVWTTKYVNDLPDSAFLYVEPGAKKDGKADPLSKRHFPYKDASGKVDLPHLRNAIARIPQSNAPGLSPARKKSLQNRARKMLGSANKENSLVERVVDVVKDLLGLNNYDPELAEPQPMMIWKEDDGHYSWLARYSNNIRDNDNPAEIISSTSHKRFVQMVDKKETPLPELWLWHVKDWKIGQTDAVAYDDSGFALAYGHFDPGKEDVAEWLSKQTDFKVSHGMPSGSIVRDNEDPSIIVEHVTAEISPLPGWAAANPITGFVVLEPPIEKEKDMIPESKRKTFIEQYGIKPELLDELERKNASDAEKATSDGRESKEKTEELEVKDSAQPVVEATTTEEQTEQVEAQTEEVTPDPLAQPPTRGEVVEAVTAILVPLREQIEQLATTVEGISAEVKSLKTAEEDRIAGAVKELPSASLAAMIAQRAVGSSSASIKKTDPLAKEKPAEEKSTGQPLSRIPFIDRMLKEASPSD